MKKSITLFFITVLIVFGYVYSDDANTTNIILTAKRLLKTQAEIIEYDSFLPISYTVNLITINKQNLAQVTNLTIQPSLVLLDSYLEEALNALAIIKKTSIEYNSSIASLSNNLNVSAANNPNMPATIDSYPSLEKTTLLTALKKACSEIEIIDAILKIPNMPY